MSVAPSATGNLAHDPQNSVSEEEQLRENLLTTYVTMEPRSKELLAEASKLPDVIPEEDIPAWQDLGASLQAHSRALDNFREIEKAPHIRANKVIENTFQQLMKPLDDTLAIVLARVKVAAQKKKDRIQAQKAEEAKKKREEAERIAAEKARVKREADEKAAEEERVRQRIEKEKRDAEQLRINAIEEQKRKDAAELKRLEDARIQREKEAAELALKLENARRRDTKEKLAGALEKTQQEAVELATAIVTTAKESETKIDRLDHLHGRASFDAELLLEEADRKVAAAKRDASRATKEADKAITKETAAIAQEEKIENADPLTYSRTRGDFGSMTSLSDRWTYVITDPSELDPAQIWPHISDEAKEKAITSMVKTGIREIPGCTVYEEERLNFRQ